MIPSSRANARFIRASDENPDYLLVSQAEPRIEHYRRGADGSWTYRAAGPGERVTLSTGSVLIVDETFADVIDLPGD